MGKPSSGTARHYSLLLGKGGQDKFISHNPNIIFKEMADLFKGLGIKRTLFIGLPFWQNEITYHLTCQRLKIPDCMGSIYNLPLYAKLCNDLKIEAVITIPQIVDAFIPYLQKEGVRHIKIWYLMGKVDEPGLKEKIKKLYPTSKLFQCYAPLVSIPLGYQCRYLEGRINEFHPSQNNLIKSKLSKDNEILMSIKRPLVYEDLNDYKTGDYGEIYERKCPCGGRVVFKIRV